VISADEFNSTRDDVLVAAITSQIPTQLATDEFMIPADALRACGLPKPSILRLSKLAALHRQLIIKRVGSLPPLTLSEVLTRLRQRF
jgi:mRNA-degrading endonuclease toxin of MazEF toxin-antitoxin module